jgi:dTDP-4-dehydrorhamnose reductase
MKILVLGVSGMLGSAMFRLLSEDPAHDVVGTARSDRALRRLGESAVRRVLTGVNVEIADSLVGVFAAVRPQVVVNCIGLIKQLADVHDPLRAVPINTLLPHRLATLCLALGARLVHVSTDCVFSGARGGYLETDFPDAHDLYGRSKLLGEVDYPHTITLRTSIIGHELASNHGLVGWFLSQSGPIKGFRKALFSGLPTVEFARVIRDVVLPRTDLHGLYHVASSPISKFELLKLIAEVYEKEIAIVPDDTLVIDRTLNAERFAAATGYRVAPWPDLVRRMHEFS